jgi:tetratricopeptide (TPR) repeat protein
MMVKNWIVLFIIAISGFGLHAQIQNPQLQMWETEADTLMSHEDFAGATKLYTKVIDESKLQSRQDYRALYKRCVAYYSQGDFKNALSDIERFIPEFPDSYQARILRALCYREFGDTDKQLMDVEKALELSGGDPQLLKWRAGLLIEKEEFIQAIEDLLLVRLLQDDPEAEMNLGFAYYSVQKADSALIAINKSIELEATFLPAYLYGGSFSLQEGQYELALKYLNVALMLEPENTTALFYKGMALLEMEKEDAACSCLRKAFYAGQDDAGDYLKQYCYGIEN